MKANVKIEALSTTTVKGENGEKHALTARKSFHTFDVEVKEANHQKQVDTIIHMAGRLVGNKLAALIQTNGNLPKVLAVTFTLNGKVYSTETAAVKAQMSEALRIKISRKLANEADIKEVANKIAGTLKSNLKAISTFVSLMKADEKAAAKVEHIITSALLNAGKAEVTEDETAGELQTA